MEKTIIIFVRFWCLRDSKGKSRSLSLEQVNKGECGGWDAVIPEGAKRFQKENEYLNLMIEPIIGKETVK